MNLPRPWSPSHMQHLSARIHTHKKGSLSSFQLCFAYLAAFVISYVYYWAQILKWEVVLSFPQDCHSSIQTSGMLHRTQQLWKKQNGNGRKKIRAFYDFHEVMLNSESLQNMKCTACLNLLFSAITHKGKTGKQRRGTAKHQWGDEISLDLLDRTHWSTAENFKWHVCVILYPFCGLQHLLSLLISSAVYLYCSLVLFFF